MGTIFGYPDFVIFRIPRTLASAPAVACRFSLMLLASLPVAGCFSGPPQIAGNAAEHHAQVTTQREEMEAIPPPTKSRFMAIHSYDSWQNPYITVQPGMVSLHVLLADANTVDFGAGGMLRPVGARRQELNLSPEKLAEAISSIPQSSWPYGRVVAIEEAHNTPAKAEPTVRRNLETTVNTLNDLGVVAYDMSTGTVR